MMRPRTVWSKTTGQSEPPLSSSGKKMYIVMYLPTKTDARQLGPQFGRPARPGPARPGRATRLRRDQRSNI